MNHTQKLPALFLLALAFPVFGQESTPTPPAQAVTSQPVTLEEIDVYAQQTGIGVKELSPDDIQDVHNSGNLGAALDHESGLETQGEGMGKSWSALAIRGQSFRETVILLNGQRVPESFNLGTIPTESIERVEVIEGPQALAYGSDALGGVLNIITRKGTGRSGSLQFSGGDFNTYQFQASTPSFGPGNFQNVLSGSWFTTDGYLAPVTESNGAVYGFTDETHWDISHSASWKMGQDQADLLTGFFKQTGSAPDADNVIAAGTDQYDLDGRQDAWGIQSLFKDLHPMGKWQLALSLSGNYSDVLRANPIGADPTSGVYNPYRNQYLDYAEQAYFSGPFDGFLTQLTLGADGHSEELWSGLYGNYSRWVVAFVTSGTCKFDNSLHLDWSNRLEYYTAYDQVDNPMATLVFSASPDWQFHLGAGKGYKLPTFDQLYLPYTNFFALPPNLENVVSQSPFAFLWNGDKGNPALLPEQSIDTEAGMDARWGGFLLQLSAFANFYQNLINPAVDPVDNFWTYVNLNNALFTGTEDSVSWKLADWCTPNTSFTWISSTDNAGNPIPGRLRLKWTAGMDLNPEKQWSLEVNARYVDRNPVGAQYAFDLFMNNGIPIAPTAYWDLEAEAKYDISEHLKGFLMVENLLNTQMASFQGIPLPGRYFEGGLQGMF